MLDLRRLRLLHELHARGTIAAVADALQFTPSAVSQQLAVLEREAGVALLERAGRGVRLTDAALVLVAPRRGAARAGRARRGRARRGRGQRRRAGRASPRSSRSRCGSPSRPCRRSRARRPACAASSSRPSPSSRCPRSRSATSISCWPTSGSTSRTRGRPASTAATCTATRSTSSCPRTTRPRARHRDAVPLAELAGEAWTTGHPEHRLGGDDAAGPAASSAASTPTSATARTTASPAWRSSPHGQAVDAAARARRSPAARPGVAVRAIAEGSVHRTDLHRHPHRRRRAPLRPGAAGGRPRRRRGPRLAAIRLGRVASRTSALRGWADEPARPPDLRPVGGRRARVPGRGRRRRRGGSTSPPTSPSSI